MSIPMYLPYVLERWEKIERSKNWDKVPDGYTKISVSGDTLYYKETVSDVEIICADGEKSWTRDTLTLLTLERKDFHSEFYSVAKAFLKKLNQLDFSGKMVEVIGSSRGGGYGLILAYLLVTKKHALGATVTTFGAPEQCKTIGIDQLKISLVNHVRCYTAVSQTEEETCQHWETLPVELPSIDGKKTTDYRKSIELAMKKNSL